MNLELKENNDINKQVWKSHLKSKIIALHITKKIIGKDKAQEVFEDWTPQELFDDLKDGIDSSKIIKKINEEKKDSVYSMLFSVFINKEYLLDLNLINDNKKELNEFNKKIFDFIKNDNKVKIKNNKIKKNLTLLNMEERDFYRYTDKAEKLNIIYDITQISNSNLIDELIEWECRNCSYKTRMIYMGNKRVLPGDSLICRLCGMIYDYNKYDDIKQEEKKENNIKKFIGLNKLSNKYFYFVF